VIIGGVFGMHHQLGGSTEDEMNKMSVIGHFFLFHIHYFTTYLVTAELFVASNLSVFLQRNTTKVRRN
jgi:hypothetical protein